MSEGIVLLVFTVPADWPPSTGVLVYSGVHEGSTISVDAGTDSKLRFTCVNDNNRHEFITPKLKMPGFANLKAAFAWGADGPMVAINGILFSEEVCRSGEVVSITSKYGEATRLREPLLVNVPHGLDLAEERLIRSLVELQQRIAKADRIHLLEASAILRRLLLDAHPLVSRVNRKYRLRLSYPTVVNTPASVPEAAASYGYLNLAPLVSPKGSVVELSLDVFLSQPVVVGESSYSVRDVIDFCANTKGGVHFDDPKSSTSKELLELDGVHLPELIDASLHAIADLSWCIVQGLRPLVMKIEAEHATA
jgi:hypothetical protein